MTALPYRIYDADNHYYEPDDCFTRHIESRFRARTVWIDRSRPGPEQRPEPAVPPPAAVEEQARQAQRDCR